MFGCRSTLTSGKSLTETPVSLGEIPISPKEIHKSPKEIGISLLDLCISLKEIGISVSDFPISFAPPSQPKPKQDALKHRSSQLLVRFHPFESRRAL